MKRFLSALPLVILAGCQTNTLPSTYKAGSTGPERQYAFDQCKIASLREIPQAMATDYNSGYYNPGTVQCNRIGNMTTCNRVGAVNIPASASTYDANAGLRNRYIGQCMQRRGFDFKILSACPTAEERQRAWQEPQPGNIADFKCNSGVNMDG